MNNSISSVMGGFLQTHAYKNVWCSPNQDKQAIFEPMRLTDLNGAWINIKVMWNRFDLPDTNSRYHVYQLGQVHPSLIGLQHLANQAWIKLSDACGAAAMVANVYSTKGYQIHLSQVWYKITNDRNILFAVRIPEYSKIPINLSTEAIYIRLYSNAYFQSVRANSPDNIVVCQGKQIVINQDILDLQNTINTYRSKGVGLVTCLLNGRICDKIDLTNTRAGDYAEFLFDGSVKRVVTLKISTLPSFESTLDQQYKYILHYPGIDDTIEYCDDTDIQLINPTPNGPVGLYYNKNNPLAVRHLTHKDYSIPVQFVQAYAENSPTVLDLDTSSLRLIVRNSGYKRSLISENHRIKELYLLPDEELLRAMTDINSTVPVWKASELEQSKYALLMRSDFGTIKTMDVQEAYGYNAISTLIGNTPQKTELISNLKRIELPSALADRCTVYEYDAQGRLLGFYNHSTGTAYACAHIETDICEVISGFAKEGLGSYWNVASHDIDPNQTHRFYKCGVVAGALDEIWSDVTGTQIYSIINNRVQWYTHPDQSFTMVRSNKDHIAYRLSYLALDGLITFSLREWREDIEAYRVMSVPMGELDIFLNGHSLIRDLDYVVDFPRVIINNKEYLIDPDNQAQDIVIRFTNFCQPNLALTDVPDYGFIQYGAISYNKRYDVRQDKVTRIVIGGSLYHPSELSYAEEDFEIRPIDAKNGQPYAIRDIIVPMNDYLEYVNVQVDPTTALRALALQVDQSISDYLTSRLPQKSTTAPNAVQSLYRLVSPFFNRIIHDLISGALWSERFTELYDDMYVRSVCQRYEYLLEWDPLSDTSRFDARYVVIHPHNSNHYLDIGIYQYKFLSRVVSIYANNKINLSSSLRIEQFGN